MNDLRKKTPFLFFVLFVVIFAASCDKEEAIPEDEFVVVFTDLIIANDTADFNKTNRLEVKKAVLKKHNITEEQYKRTLDFYNKDPEKWKEFFDRAVTRAESLMNSSK
ncbi:MAG: DUF4296 domain-containing protein [Ignavibacteriaceae bacterium]|nr:DUF4296 domain-containing protein [Ignavibacteriaceae bacterium]